MSKKKPLLFDSEGQLTLTARHDIYSCFEPLQMMKCAHGPVPQHLKTP